jgi:acetyl-CoA carboxylase beta subunit
VSTKKEKRKHFLGGKQRTPLGRCLGCGIKIDACSGLDTHDKACEDALTICMYCNHVMAFTADLRLRDLTVDEMIEAMQDDRVRTAQMAITIVNKRKR